MQTGKILGFSKVLDRSHCILNIILVDTAQDSDISFEVFSLDNLLIIPAHRFLEVLEFFLTSVVSAVKDLRQLLHIKRCLFKYKMVGLSEITGILTFTFL
jgi:hypothetical protein